MSATLNDQLSAWVHAHRAGHANAGRPWVTLCYAQSLDGSLALRAGEPLILSNRDSLTLTHRLRSLHDGILVGIGTVLADDPQLTVRECSGASPQPIVLDSRGRLPAHARVSTGHQRCWVFTSEATMANPRDDIERIVVPTGRDGVLELSAVLSVLWQRGIRTLMVEGGARVIQGFLKSGLADAVVLTLAPRFVGGYKAVDALGYARQEQIPRLTSVESARLQDDLIIWGELDYGTESRQ